MVKFEYKSVIVMRQSTAYTNFDKEINKEGEMGWEFAALLDSDPGSFLLLFKRRLEA